MKVKFVLGRWWEGMRPSCFLAVVVFLSLSGDNLCAQNVTIDGSQVFQTIEGFGVNVNHRSWTNNELQPVLDAFIDEAGMTLFRVIWDNTDWEGTNDNADPNVMNWAYYNQVYSAPEFQQLWGIMGYLNQRGITNGVMVNFQGPGPVWMGGTNYLIAGYENEWAEMIASLFIYARNTQHLQFSLIAPDNEPDCYMGIYGSEGVRMTFYQYPTALHCLAQQLDNHGMSDVRFVAPDAQSGSGYLWQMMNDPVVMAKMAHVGIHSYFGGGDGSAGVQQILKDPPFNGMTFWMTEFNVWCTACEWSGTNTYSWDDCRDTASYLLAHLTNGASGGIVWEGYDSYYRILNNWSCWGLFAANGQFAVPKIYTPRKNFYTVAQITKFVRPGAHRIAVIGSPGTIQLLAFYHPDTGQLTLTGVNSASSPVNLSVALTSLPAVSMLGLYYTDIATNLAYGATCRVTNSTFAVTLPAKCVFTLVGQDSSKIVPTLTIAARSNSFTISWSGALTDYFLETTTNLGTPSWTPLANDPQLAGGLIEVTLVPAGRQQYFRLHHN